METGIDLLTKIFHHADEPHQDWKNTILGVLHQVHNHKDKYESKALKRCSKLIGNYKKLYNKQLFNTAHIFSLRNLNKKSNNAENHSISEFRHNMNF